MSLRDTTRELSRTMKKKFEWFVAAGIDRFNDKTCIKVYVMPGTLQNQMEGRIPKTVDDFPVLIEEIETTIH